MDEPQTIDEFKVWCESALAELEGMLDDPDSSNCIPAEIVNRAKLHAYRLTVYDLADVLPERDDKSVLDGCLRMRGWIGVDQTKYRPKAY